MSQVYPALDTFPLCAHVQASSGQGGSSEMFALTVKTPLSPQDSSWLSIKPALFSVTSGE